jgi:hypothetical protein
VTASKGTRAKAGKETDTKPKINTESRARTKAERDTGTIAKSI